MADFPIKFLMCCSITTVVLLLIALTTLVALYFTILNPKKPRMGMVMQSVTLEGYRLASILPRVIHLKLGVMVSVNNRNYGSFKYENGTTYVTYRGARLAEAPIEEDTLHARTNHNISSTVKLSADKLVSNTGFLGNYMSG